ncbi:MAG: hypothetical protein IH804_03575 [Planctomycetes bacterium]|nr:hypothetical protein [Planctomycetota bacterium]
MPARIPHLVLLGVVAAGAALAPIAPQRGAVAAPDRFLLLRRDHHLETIQLVGIRDQTLVYGDHDQGFASVLLSSCLAIFRAEAAPADVSGGLLRLADGQRFPGRAFSGASGADGVLVWDQSSWLGRMEVPLQRIESVAFTQGAAIPRMGDGDRLRLANGDRLEGLVTALGDPILLEVAEDGRRTIQIPLDRAASVRMVTPRQTPSGRRLWLIDGTIIDVSAVEVGDDVLRPGGLPFVSQQPTKPLSISSLVAVLFDTEGLVPFAALEPVAVKGPLTRYVVPRPELLDDLAPLGLARVLLRGPVSIRYELPSAESYLMAEARLPPEARRWGDCELLIRDEGREVFRARLNADNPVVPIGVTIHGTQLEIEITEGANGPVYDHVVLHRAMVIRE